MKLVVASSNQGKIVEVRRLLEQLGLEVSSMEQAGIDPGGELPEPFETFAENAASKAHALADLAPDGWWCLGDDSGLEVDALAGAPGVYSARYAGVEGKGPARDQANNAKLLRELEGVGPAERTARFVCCMALVIPGQDAVAVRGTCEGSILEAPRGQGGFGYDPLFRPAGFEHTMAELSLDEKNRISHRGQALQGLVAAIRSRIGSS